MSESEKELPPDQQTLFDAEAEGPAANKFRLLVHFRNAEDRQAFSTLIGQVVAADTKVIHFPFNGKALPQTFDAEQADQTDLFSFDDNWRPAWRGMPPYSNEDQSPYQTIEVFFDSRQDQQAFARLTDNSVTVETKSVWFPKVDVDAVVNLRWRSTRPQNPKYPVYVPTKGRWESAFTIKCMETLGIPYFAVVQPQELDKYKPVVKTGTILTLPEGLDGLVPTRNWIYEHSIASGAERHWQLDDNIKSFFRYHENRQIHVADGTCMRVAEDFADRYENVAIAGFQYFMFVPRKKVWPPFVFNTRVYSNSLINNRMHHRYRDVYNDDTDICLRALKEGMVTVQFNAFLAWKQPTMIVKGGNTPIYLGAEKVAADWVAHAAACKLCEPDVSPEKCEEGRAILQKDGRWRMAESLRRQHPDVTTVGRRWNRWQHYVDYRRFKNNVPILRPGVVIPEGQDDYGLELVEVAGKPKRQAGRAAKAPRTAKPSGQAKPAKEAASQPGGASALAFALAKKPTVQEVPGGTETVDRRRQERVEGDAETVDRGPASGGVGPAAVGEHAEGGCVSALDFGRRLQPVISAPPVAAGAEQAAPAAPVEDQPRADAEGQQAQEPLTADLSPAEFKLRLEIRGHVLMKLDDFFFITDMERLTPEECAAVKLMGRRLLEVADEWDGKEFFAPEPPSLPEGATGLQADPDRFNKLTEPEPPSLPEGANGVDPNRGTSDVSVAGREETITESGQESSSSPNEKEAAREATWQNNLDQAAKTVEIFHTLNEAPPSIDFNQLNVSEALDAAAKVTGVMYEDPGLIGFNAGPVADGTFFDEPAQGQTLAQFLGSEPPRYDPNYRPDDLPDLTGIDEIVLNFAADGVDWDKGHRPGGVTVSTMDGKLCRFLPWRFASGNLDEEQVKRWAKEQLRGKKITNAKTKFDVHMARVWGVDLEAQGCTFSDIHHTAALLDDHRKRFAIDLLAADYLPDLPPVARLDESRHLEHHAAEAAEREKFTASLVWRLRDVMYPEIEKQELRQVHDLEDSVIPTVVEMEKNGSPIDMPLLEQYGRECKAAHDALMIEISREAGFAFEHTASGWKRLIESLRLPVPDSFSEASLNEVDHPLIRKGQRASQYASLHSKIFKAYPEHIVDGILRYSINQLASDDGGTVSGRFSIGIVQQVPNKDNHYAAFGDALYPRRLFIPGPGAKGYGEADAAQIEFRLLVDKTKNKELLQAYRDDPKMSFHKAMQAKLIRYKPDMLYTHTKSYNFAAQYGARSIKLASMMGFITEREGNEIRAAKRWDDPRLNLIKEIEAAYAQAHPEAGALLELAGHLAKSSCDDFCRRGDKLHRQYQHRGFVRTLAGRRSRYPNNYKTYTGLNRVLQGSGADIMKKKLVELHDARKDTGFVMRITNHDAVLGDVMQDDTMEKVAAILDRQSYPLAVPILWECKQGPNWADCH